MEFAEIIRSYIVDNFLFGDDTGLRDDASFLDQGIMDSSGKIDRPRCVAINQGEGKSRIGFRKTCRSDDPGAVFYGQPEH